MRQFFPVSEVAIAGVKTLGQKVQSAVLRLGCSKGDAPNLKARTTLQPATDLLVFVRRIVVHDKMMLKSPAISASSFFKNLSHSLWRWRGATWLMTFPLR